MSILDDAIREHLELKRAHGADDAEVKRLEDEAFGPPQRPDEHDPFAEAPTEFLVAPEVGRGEQADEPGERRAPNIADLQEAPEPRQAPEPTEAPAAEEDDAPADEEHPAMEHEAIADPGHSTEERHAIADQPTEMFDVEAQFEDAATEADAPSDDELVDAELTEPRLAPVDPLAGIEARSAPSAPAEPAAAEDESADEFDEFFNEQRLSDELDQALEAPLPDEPGAQPTEEAVFIDLDDEEDEDARRARLRGRRARGGALGRTRGGRARGARRARGRHAAAARAARLQLPARGRARGHPGVPRGRARGRRPLVRAEAAEGLRLRRLAEPAVRALDRLPG